MLLLDGRSLQIADVMAVADGRQIVGLAPEARSRMQVTRDVVERAVARAEPVYGINTGFGKLSEVTIAGDQLAALQRNLVRSHAAGVGDPLPEREVRVMMLLRANVLLIGLRFYPPKRLVYLSDEIVIYRITIYSTYTV